MPILSGSDAPVRDKADAKALAAQIGYPVIVKAAMGGGGRGMRVARRPEDLDEALDQARREAGAAFGIADVFLEKYIQRARHIEVQLVGDRHGQLVHLYERDCTLQRRHQKIVEIAPAPNLDPGTRRAILEAALAVGRAVGLDNAGTVEFLLDADTGRFFFIEVNPRIQVEHTVTEAVTGFDLVKTQILVAQGRPLSDPEIGLGSQDAVRHARLRPAMPGHDRGSEQGIRPGLWPDQRLPLGERHGHPPRRRHRLRRAPSLRPFTTRFW